MAGLNEKQRAFCHAFMTNGGNATAAYETAYGRGKMNDDSLRVQGSRAMKRPVVQNYLAELRAPIKEANKTTTQSLVDELEAGRKFAEKMGNPSAYIAAILGKAKLLGLDKGNGGDEDEAQPLSVTVTVRDARVSRADA